MILYGVRSYGLFSTSDVIDESTFMLCHNITSHYIDEAQCGNPSHLLSVVVDCAGQAFTLSMEFFYQHWL
jgi:hypothetical protein